MNAPPRPWRSRSVQPLAALAVAIAAFALSCLFLPAKTAPFSMGLEFAAMSTDPFGWHGRFPHRVLGPAAAWLLGLGGERYWLFAHATVVGFLALVCFAALRGGAPLLGSALLTAAIAVSGAVEVFKDHVGYAEPASCALLLGGALLVRRTGWFWAVQFLALLNHEGVVFLWPWLLWRKVRANGGVRRGDVLGLAAAGGGYLAVRWAIFAAAPQPVLSAGVYAGGPLTTATLCTWALAAISIAIYFGALPVLLAWHARARGWRDAGVPVLLALAGVFAMCTFATDMPRFLAYLALPLVAAGIALARLPHGSRWLAVIALATMVAIPLQRPVAAAVVDAFRARVAAGVAEPLATVVVDLWPVFAGYGVLLAAMAFGGRALARRVPGERAVAAESVTA